MLDLIGEVTRQCPAIRIGRKLSSTDVIDVLADQFIMRDVPGHIRSDNGPGDVAIAVRNRTTAIWARAACIEQGGKWEKGFCGSFNSRPRYELLDGETFDSLAGATVVIESWRRHHNTRCPRSSLGYRPPAQEIVTCPPSVPRS